MIDAAAFASLLCDWCLEVAPRQQIIVTAPTTAEPLVRAMHNALLERGAWPLPRMAPSDIAADFHAHARDEHLDDFAPLELSELQEMDGILVISAPSNTRALAAVDPARIARAAAARQRVLEARLAKRWCGTLWPTPGLAQDARMSTPEYEQFVSGALFLDRADPVAAWRKLSDRQDQIVGELAGAREIHIEAEGTDLRLRVDGRTWINSNGRRNMPSGEVFTGPVENSANGTIRFTLPSNHRGAEVTGVKLTFVDGRVTDYSAEQGGDYLEAALATDHGARYLGELGIGTNAGIDRATGSTLLDEKIAGTVHLALGRSYPETGGLNKSALHWDLVCDLRQGGQLSADGQMLNDKLWSVG
jgi:aminopeptidase